MPLFPVFVDLTGKKVLVVGGGKVGTRKVKSLLPFGPEIVVVSPEFTADLERLGREGRIKLLRRRFMSGDLKGADLVVVAVDDERLQRRIYRMCKKRGVPCNSVDSPQWCSFIFPSLIVRGDLVIGITTSGKVPALSRRVREIVEKCLPDDIEEVLRTLAKERASMEKGERRQRKIKDLVNKLIPTMSTFNLR
ncbi:MAG: bifunctional precorrin-2 dehydrogenase/sirohydrochlorin ferrochelatase [Aquificota bacterium]|nr:bifunctional precorrin-2 dehydrogenase/sirohydrochlorin ferrochelatase [Aquificota bacterium]